VGVLAASLDRFEWAESSFAAATAVHKRVGARAWLARTQFEWADMLLRRQARGDDVRAGALLHQTLATAVDLGLGAVERRTRALLEGAL
jgi:hypothetical protein